MLSFAGLLLAIVVTGAIVAGPAAAEYRHQFVTAEFGPDGTSASKFGEVNALAYHEASDRLFALDVDGSIHGFAHPAPGTFTPLGGNFPISHAPMSDFSDLAVDNSAASTAGDIYLAPAALTIKSYDADGSALATAYQDGGSQICGVAVDSVGHIWGSGFSKAATEFGPGSPTPIRTVNTNGGADSPCKLAIDRSTNDLYLSSFSGTGVWKYTAASGYATAQKIDGGFNDRVVVNSAKHVLYVGGFSSNGVIRGYSTITGDLVETSQAPGPYITGLAVDEATDTLFVAMGESNRIQEMPGLVAPKATTNEPGGTAAVAGIADPDGAGPITECYFEFGGTSDYGRKQNCAQSLPIKSATTVTATLPGLLQEEYYYYRLVVGTATPGAQAKGAQQAIRLRNVRKLQTEAASQIDRTKARLNASFEGTNEATSYYFEYGMFGYQSRFPAAPDEELVAPSVGPTTISVPISGLSAGTSYSFRVVAKNSKGVSIGDGVGFTTLPAVNSVLTEAATGITKTTATLHGSYDGATNDIPPGPLESFHYYFEWGKTDSYGNTTAAPPGVAGGAHAETVHVSAPLAGLSALLPDSPPYHYRLVVSNSTGTTYGPDMTLRTNPPDPPLVGDARVEGVQRTAASVAASVNPSGLQTSFLVEFGIKSGVYVRTSPARAVGSGMGAVPVSVPLEDLVPGTVYYFRASATSAIGTAVSPEQTFTTPDLPLVESSEASAGTTSARLSASVIANASATSVRFEYGTGNSYGSVTAPVDAGSSLRKGTVSAELNGLQPGTTYHFRALATNGVGGASGPDETFTTQPASSQAGPIVVKPNRSKSCKRGFVKRKGKCVKKPRKHKKKRKHAGRR